MQIETIRALLIAAEVEGMVQMKQKLIYQTLNISKLQGILVLNIVPRNRNFTINWSRWLHSTSFKLD
ncbi:hypothetical protein ACT7DH_15305 [Bacillus pacificus]